MGTAKRKAKPAAKKPVRDRLKRIESWPIAHFKPYAKNARTHSEDQVKQLAASISQFGWTVPILCTPAGSVIAGHGRLEAAISLGMKSAPVIVAKGWTAAQVRAYRLADNKLALNAGWDEELLGLEVADLTELGFNMTFIGFDEKELVSFEAKKGGEDAPGIKYEEKFAVLVECENEPAQQKALDKLTAEGFTCRILVN
jgi:ParB-like chromosome segregation protein Spo0J